MNCRECQMQMPEYVDGVVAGPDLLQLEAHVRTCPACADALAGEQAALARFAGMLEPGLRQCTLTTQAREKLAAAGKTGAVRPSLTFSWRPVEIRLLAMAASILLLAGSRFVFDQGPSRSSLGKPDRSVPAAVPRGLERTNALSQFFLVACMSNSSEQLAVNIVHRVSR